RFVVDTLPGALFPVRRLPRPPLFPYTTLFRSSARRARRQRTALGCRWNRGAVRARPRGAPPAPARSARIPWREPEARREVERVRSEEHTSELQSPDHLVCRLLLEKKKQRHANR